jgi:antitoxin YefM
LTALVEFGSTSRRAVLVRSQDPEVRRPLTAALPLAIVVRSAQQIGASDAAHRASRRSRRWPYTTILIVTITGVMSTESLATVKATLSEVVDRVEKYHERVIITRRGREAAVILSPDDLRSLEETIAVLSDPATMLRLQEADAAIADGDVVDAEQLRSMVGLPPGGE